jgi:hypothetical protein
VYRIEGAFRKADYADKAAVIFTLNKGRSSASLSKAVAKSHTDLKLAEKKDASDADRALIENEITAGIATARIQFRRSAYKHNASRDGDSQHVGDLDNEQTADFINQHLATDKIRYLGEGENGGDECIIELAGRETIMFEYFTAGFITVFHCGPGK